MEHLESAAKYPLPCTVKIWLLSSFFSVVAFIKLLINYKDWNPWKKEIYWQHFLDYWATRPVLGCGECHPEQRCAQRIIFHAIAKHLLFVEYTELEGAHKDHEIPAALPITHRSTACCSWQSCAMLLVLPHCLNSYPCSHPQVPQPQELTLILSNIKYLQTGLLFIQSSTPNLNISCSGFLLHLSSQLVLLGVCWWITYRDEQSVNFH